MDSKINKDTVSSQKSGNTSEHRRKRINRIKTAIVIIVILFLILPTIICIYLGLQVNQLQKQMKELMELHREYGLSYEDTGGIDYAYAAEKPSDADVDSTTKEQTFEEEDKSEKEQAAQDQTATTDNNRNVEPLSSAAGQKEAVPAQAISTDTDVNAVNADNDTSGDDEKSGKDIYQGKTVYLTFDDGPSIYTDDILDILAQYDVKATFFVIGKTDDTSKKLYQRIVDEGHTLGMHSYSHKYDRIYNSLEDFDKDFTKLWKLLYDTTGYKPSIYRFPGGSDNQVNKNGMDDFIRFLNDKSIVYFDWNVVSGDATGVEYTKDQLTDHVLSGVAQKDTSIVLMHDSQTKETTVESLPGLLDKLILGGAKILPLDEDVSPIQMIKADSVK